MLLQAPLDIRRQCIPISISTSHCTHTLTCDMISAVHRMYRLLCLRPRVRPSTLITASLRHPAVLLLRHTRTRLNSIQQTS